MDIREEVFDTLRSYVYIYLDPRTGEPFYVGKGRGRRFLAHLEDQSESEKARQIAEIRLHGQEPQIEFLRYGLSDEDAALVEAAAIDLLGKTKLTNVCQDIMQAVLAALTQKSCLRCCRLRLSTCATRPC